MSRCKSCGTGGLFFKLDDEGLCESCAIKKRKAIEEINKRKELDFTEKWLKEIQDKHFKIISEIKQYSGRAIQGKDKKLTERVYGLCLNDVALIPEYTNRAKRFACLWREIYGSTPPISNFSTAFETMAFIEQKRNNSKKSIELCLQAIESGSGKQHMEELIEVFTKPYKPRIIHPAYTEYWK